jgi:hypothetical protein
MIGPFEVRRGWSPILIFLKTRAQLTGFFEIRVDSRKLNRQDDGIKDRELNRQDAKNAKNAKEEEKGEEEERKLTLQTLITCMFINYSILLSLFLGVLGVLAVQLCRLRVLAVKFPAFFSD